MTGRFFHVDGSAEQERKTNWCALKCPRRTFIPNALRTSPPARLSSDQRTRQGSPAVSHGATQKKLGRLVA
jgi:hypothetical protein